MSNYSSYSQAPQPTQPYAQPQVNGQPTTYPPMAYPPPPYGISTMGMPRPVHPQASTVLILGILGFFVSGLLSPIAWYMGNKARKEVDAGLYAPSDQLNVGRILGMIGSILLIVIFAILAFVMIGAIILAMNVH